MTSCCSPPLDDLRDLLDDAAADAAPAPPRGLHFYRSGSFEHADFLSYADLRALALRNAAAIRSLPTFEPEKPVLLHFDDHRDNVVWLWSVAYAGAVPAMSTPFVSDPAGRSAHVKHLHALLEDPLCLTRARMVERDFADVGVLRVAAVETLEQQSPTSDRRRQPQRRDGLALLVLTSGSTGHAKAVCLTHAQLAAAVRGKSAALSTAPATAAAFLNFIGLDHVAALAEIHLHALLERVDQVHVSAADAVSRPAQFLRLAARHKAAKTVAPNFFLARLRDSERDWPADVDLSCLTHIVSGGEANPVDTVAQVAGRLARLGVKADAVVPSFGMSETAAGCTYNRSAPAHDAHAGYEFCSLGAAVPGLAVRIAPADAGADRHAPGSVQLRGPLVFERYYNDATATAAAFTPDGWFATGDEGFVNDLGHLVLSGRTKDLVVVNGLKYLPHELEHAVAAAAGPDLVRAGSVCGFSFRRRADDTERVAVVYVPAYAREDADARRRAFDAVTAAAAVHTGAACAVVPLDDAAPHMQRSTLGKLSRGKIRAAYVGGAYESYVAQDAALLQQTRRPLRSAEDKDDSRSTEEEEGAERIVLGVLRDVLRLDEATEIDPAEPYLQLGVTSLDLIRMRKQLEPAFNLGEGAIPLLTLMTAGTPARLAAAVAAMARRDQQLTPPPSPSDAKYDPIVTLRPPSASDTAPPLFLLHPGVGEILVFLPLARALPPNRAVYALRARGFDANATPFVDLADVLDTYTAAIVRTRPAGPISLAGYSWGGMLAFELAKRLEAAERKVGFVGVLNLPPHIAWRMRQLHWAACLAHLALFLGLLAREEDVDAAVASVADLDAAAAAETMVKAAPAERVDTLGLTAQGLKKWVDVAFALQRSAVGYEPAGSVEAPLRVFHCEPLAALKLTRAEWVARHLRAWEAFGGDVKLEAVGGSHYTMLSEEHVDAFVGVFAAAMQEAER